jgi:acyl dehydratase
VIDRNFIGAEAPPRSIEVEKYPIRFFALAIGETDPIYSDEAAAQAAGYRSLVAPPTYVACLNNLCANPRTSLFQRMGVPMERVLHGEQSMTYHRPVIAGDILTFRSRVTDIYDKKGGALEFIVNDTAVTDQHGESVADMRAVIVVRNQEAS